MRVGQKAEVEIDAYPGLKLEGEVESLSGATGSRFSLLPPDNATGNFTKVVQRVPVRIKLLNLPKDRVLRPGMSADVTVDQRKAPWNSMRALASPAGWYRSWLQAHASCPRPCVSTLLAASLACCGGKISSPTR